MPEYDYNTYDGSRMEILPPRSAHEYPYAGEDK